MIGLEGENALDIQPVDSVALAAYAELLHDDSLIHDDLQDRSLERRERVAVSSCVATTNTTLALAMP